MQMEKDKTYLEMLKFKEKIEQEWKFEDEEWGDEKR